MFCRCRLLVCEFMQFQKIDKAVCATSPNRYNMANSIKLNGKLVLERLGFLVVLILVMVKGMWCRNLGLFLTDFHPFQESY